MVRRVLYWLAVLAVSLVLVIGLILLLESRDRSGVGPGSAATSLANATIRFEALYFGWHAVSTSRSSGAVRTTHVAVGRTIRMRSTS